MWKLNGQNSAIVDPMCWEDTDPFSTRPVSIVASLRSSVRSSESIWLEQQNIDEIGGSTGSDLIPMFAFILKSHVFENVYGWAVGLIGAWAHVIVDHRK
jgi:hypothetical protein